MPKQSDDLSREGEQSQTTDKGLEITVPKRKAFGGLMTESSVPPYAPRLIEVRARVRRRH